MKRSTKRNTIAIATALTTLLSATAVLADTQSGNTVEAPKTTQTQQCETNGSFKSHLDSLVNSGTINETQKETVKRAIPTGHKHHSVKGEFNKGRHNGEFNRGYHKGQLKTVLAALVKNGTITQAQADSILSAMKGKKSDTINVNIKAVLDGLVKNGTITQVQEDAIQSGTKPAVEAVKAVEAVDAVPAVELKTVLNNLVKSGIMTQDQVDAVNHAIKLAKVATPVVTPAI